MSHIPNAVASSIARTAQLYALLDTALDRYLEDAGTAADLILIEVGVLCVDDSRSAYAQSAPLRFADARIAASPESFVLCERVKAALARFLEDGGECNDACVFTVRVVGDDGRSAQTASETIELHDFKRFFTEQN